MTKKKKLELKNSLDDLEYINENNDLIFHKLIFNPLLRVCGLLILLIFSLINNDRIYRLARITSNAIFSSEVILGPGTYYTVLAITLALCIGISLAALIIKPKLNMGSITLLRRMYRLYSIYDLIVFILSTFVVLFFIIMILITPCNISGDSMNNTYQDGDRVVIWNIGYQPQDNDVIVFDATNYAYHEDNSRFFIKRIVAREMDEVTFITTANNYGNLFVNDKFIEEISIYQYQAIFPDSLEISNSFIMPKKKVMVFGDNRSISYDSRSFGLIDTKDIVGKVLFRFYPFNLIGNPSPDILT